MPVAAYAALTWDGVALSSCGGPKSISLTRRMCVRAFFSSYFSGRMNIRGSLARSN